MRIHRRPVGRCTASPFLAVGRRPRPRGPRRPPGPQSAHRSRQSRRCSPSGPVSLSACRRVFPGARPASTPGGRGGRPRARAFALGSTTTRLPGRAYHAHEVPLGVHSPGRRCTCAGVAGALAWRSRLTAPWRPRTRPRPSATFHRACAGGGRRLAQRSSYSRTRLRFLRRAAPRLRSPSPRPRPRPRRAPPRGPPARRPALRRPAPRRPASATTWGSSSAGSSASSSVASTGASTRGPLATASGAQAPRPGRERGVGKAHRLRGLDGRLGGLLGIDERLPGARSPLPPGGPPHRAERARRPRGPPPRSAWRPDGRFGLATDVHAPARQLGGQAGVLPLLADGQRQGVVGHDHLGLFRLVIQDDALHLGRAEGVGDERLLVLRPGHHVDLFAVQLVDDVLDAHTAHADARAHRVDPRLQRGHGHLEREPACGRSP